MMKHESVLLEKSIEALHIEPNGIYVDGTLGRGGHSLAIANQLTNGHLYSFDKDEDAILQSVSRLHEVAERVTLIHCDFCKLQEELQKRAVERINGLILDLGVSSPQFDQQDRGFSYRFDSRLDMRMDQKQFLSAYEVVNQYSYQQLVSIFYRYGEEKFAKQIARKIEKARQNKPIETTFELVDLVRSALPAKVVNAKGHPAKQIFQAIRIEVNHELDSLQKGLTAGLDLLQVGGRISVITFHSLEDRIVKEMFRERITPIKIDPNIPLLPSQIPQAKYRLVTRKPVMPNERELNENKRSRSARLRTIERIEE